GGAARVTVAGGAVTGAAREAAGRRARGDGRRSAGAAWWPGRAGRRARHVGGWARRAGLARAVALLVPAVALLATMGGPARGEPARHRPAPDGATPGGATSDRVAPGGLAPVAEGPGFPVAATPATITTTRFTPHGFLVAGVREVPTARGPLRVMVLRMRAASLTDYRMRTRDGSPELDLGADSLELRGRVTLYLSRFKGCVEGLLCLTFTPDRLPVPPLVPPFVFLTEVEADQALVTSDSIATDGLTLTPHT
ncbi:hypothetical protein, partial [Streptomyces sp. NPDC057676]